MFRLISAALLTPIALLGCSQIAEPRADDALREIVPACASPAPLLGTYQAAAPDYIVKYNDNVDAAAETARLAAAFGFTPRFVYQAAIRGFAAPLSPNVVASIRCERSVQYVEHDAIAHAMD